MTDEEILEAVCSLAGTGSDVTVEELQLLDRLAEGVGLDREEVHTLIEKNRNNPAFTQEQIDLVMRDRDGAMRQLIEVARREGLLDQGHAMMLLWRVATKLEMPTERFEALLAASGAAPG